MTIREIFRQELSLRGIALKDQAMAEEWVKKERPGAATLLDKECPPLHVPMIRKVLGDLADDVYAPIRDRQ